MTDSSGCVRKFFHTRVGALTGWAFDTIRSQPFFHTLLFLPQPADMKDSLVWPELANIPGLQPAVPGDPCRKSRRDPSPASCPFLSPNFLHTSTVSVQLPGCGCNRG